MIDKIIVTYKCPINEELADANVSPDDLHFCHHGESLFEVYISSCKICGGVHYIESSDDCSTDNILDLIRPRGVK